MNTQIPTPSHRLDVTRATEFSEDDLLGLCEAADAAILDGGGFGWLTPPGRTAMESYFRGVLLVPERALFVAKLDGVPVGAAQLVRPPRNNEAQAFSAQMMHMFIAPYARGKGLARMMLIKLEDAARAQGYQVLNLDVRETQQAAIALFCELGYEQWGAHPCYARAAGTTIGGVFFFKRLQRDSKA